MQDRSLWSLRALVTSILLACACLPALAEGAVSGRVTAPEGTNFKDIKVALVPMEGRLSRRSIKLGKAGEFYFGMVPDGRYTLALEGTTLVPHSLKILIVDTEARKELLNFEGPAPSEPTPIDVNIKLKVTYDMTIGPASKSPAAVRAAQDALVAVPGLIQAGDFPAALQRIETALETTPDDATANYYRAFVLFKMKNYDGALPAIDRCLQLDPAQASGQWLRGAILASAGRKQEALDAFRKETDSAAAEPATRLNAWINIGLIQRELGNRDGAIAAFEKVVELDSTQSEAYSYLADLYLAVGKPEKAAEIEARSRAVGAEDATALFNLGANYWNKKEFAKAEEYFRRATEVDPKFAMAWKNLGFALVNMGRTAEAAGALNRYLELEPGAPDRSEIQQMLEALKTN